MTRYLAAFGPRALLASLLLSSALVGTAFAQTTLSTTLSGPGSGNGVADVTFDPGAGTVCYSVLLNLNPPATQAHIHRGEAGVNGPILIRFFDTTPEASGSPSGCVEQDSTVISQILANTAGFYVNVHNADFPSGALRGQLGQQ